MRYRPLYLDFRQEIPEDLVIWAPLPLWVLETDLKTPDFIPLRDLYDPQNSILTALGSIQGFGTHILAIRVLPNSLNPRMNLSGGQR